MGRGSGVLARRGDGGGLAPVRVRVRELEQTGSVLLGDGFRLKPGLRTRRGALRQDAAATYWISGPTRADYFSAATPAAAIWPSCAEVTPETPMAPTIFPTTTSGRPPSIGRIPGVFKTRRPSPPAVTVS